MENQEFQGVNQIQGDFNQVVKQKKRKKAIGFAFKLPAIILMLGSVGAGVYASIMKLAGITWVTPAILGVITVLYLIGEIITYKK